MICPYCNDRMAYERQEYGQQARELYRCPRCGWDVMDHDEMTPEERRAFAARFVEALREMAA